MNNRGEVDDMNVINHKREQIKEKFSWERSIIFSYHFCLSFISFLFLFFILCDELVELWRFSNFFPFLSFLSHFILFFILLCHCKLFYEIFVFFSTALFGAIALFLGVFVTCFALFNAISFLFILVLHCLLNSKIIF
jgi:hypothetical protein